MFGVDAGLLQVVIISGTVPDTEQTQIRFFHIFGQRDGISRYFDHNRVIASCTERDCLPRAVHVVIHRIRILNDTESAEHIDFRLAVHLHCAAVGTLYPHIVRQMARFDLKFFGKGLSAVLRENLLRCNFTHYLRLIVVRNVRAVRKAMMIRAHLKGEPVLMLSTERGIGDKERKATALVIFVLFLEHLNTGNVLLVSRQIGIGKGIVCHTGTINYRLRYRLSVVTDRLRCIVRIDITRNQGSNFYLSGLCILYIESISEPVFRCQSELIQIDRRECFFVIIGDG